jgi:hypothetical protein
LFKLFFFFFLQFSFSHVGVHLLDVNMWVSRGACWFLPYKIPLFITSTLISTLSYLLGFLSKLTSSCQSIHKDDKVVTKIKITVNNSRLLKQESKMNTWRTVSQLDQFYRGPIYQLLQHDNIYKLAARTMAVRFSGSTFNRLNLVYYYKNWNSLMVHSKTHYVWGEKKWVGLSVKWAQSMEGGIYRLMGNEINFFRFF